jgi:hypothetical protein
MVPFYIYTTAARSGAKFSLVQRVWRQLCTRKGARIITAALTLVLYVKFRSFLAVDQLVRIYREVTRIPVYPI